MAVISHIICEVCKQDREVNHSGRIPPKVCDSCLALQTKDKEQAHFAHLDSLSLEERVRRIEKWIYNYKPHIPLNEMMF